ncbi:MAG: mannose-1-phosphate guanylyltransferase/mannose-6-phosphate isomerase [Caulobacteraceae bacterium]|nr:mannose-1-phosphate guanylyltransferase/mannose-6-phosphate isomerase [Caulobacteraceae bacterium]
MSSRIVPVILSGGAGSRLWPLSHEGSPKQFLPLVTDRTMLQETALRTSGDRRFAPVVVVGNADHRFVIAEQLRACGAEVSRIILEPEGRNTAPACAAAALVALRDDPNALILIMPADHVVRDELAFLRALDIGERAARAGAFVLFGITPSYPATGYGYIRRGAYLPEAAGVWKVDAFVEKPDAARAQDYLDSGLYSWNSGIFLLPAAAYVDELARLEPKVLEAARSAVAAADEDADFLRLDPEAWSQSPSISIDYAVMERTAAAAVVPADIGWTDVGAWSALWDIGERSEAGNITVGDAFAHEAQDCYLRSEGPLIAASGVKDLIVVATSDSVLIVPRTDDQRVKPLLDALRLAGLAVAGKGASPPRGGS